MDTKLKKSKILISFITFFIGVSLLLNSMIQITSWLINERSYSQSLLDGDYQNSNLFKDFIRGRLEAFIGIATDADFNNRYGWYESDYSSYDAMKFDKNLLFIIENNGEDIYSNTEEIAFENGTLSAPENYNFILFFDGQKVQITKDGKAVEIYGDGNFIDYNQWYVPGYNNFPVDSTLKTVKIFMAAAKEPIPYTYNFYGKTNYVELENELYYIARDVEISRNNALILIISNLVAIALLALSFFLRKDRLLFLQGISKFTGKLWFEVKLIILGVLIGLCFFGTYYSLESNGTFFFFKEMIAENNFSYNNFIYPILRGILNNALVIIGIFWSIYFIKNDVKYNAKPWQNSLTCKLYRLFDTKLLAMPILKKIVIRYIPVFVLTIIFGVSSVVLVFNSRSQFTGFTWFPSVLLCILLCVIVLLQYLFISRIKTFAEDFNLIKDKIEEIRNGNYTESNFLYKDQELMLLSCELDDIRLGMEDAVNEKIKSERMKVELITNVSHDIKTPLTSIISYIDLLNHEPDLPAHVTDYIRILNDKALRLNQMIQDVFSVSKAVSGELPVNMEKLDFSKLLRQTLADMDEQILSSAITIKTDISEAPVMINADGQRLYRVFQNLILNAVKYSLEGSRIHITLTKDASLAIASIKNTSRNELNPSTNFAERFLRGDESRTDGGSGLGLSIAQSFTEACGGKFHMETIADLFVVTVSFESNDSMIY